jgi:hypothetical protein
VGRSQSRARTETETSGEAKTKVREAWTRGWWCGELDSLPVDLLFRLQDSKFLWVSYSTGACGNETLRFSFWVFPEINPNVITVRKAPSPGCHFVQ